MCGGGDRLKNYSLGIADDDFIRGKVPMTKQEVRILTLAKARIRPEHIVVDIGAGTGSLTIESSFLANDGHVYAIEKNPEAVELLQENINKFERSNITVLAGYAPDIMPSADVYFDTVLIGGSGGRLKELLQIVDKRLKPDGRIIINAVTLETLSECTALLKDSLFVNYEHELVCVQVTRMKQAGSYNLFDALNPVYILVARKI